MQLRDNFGFEAAARVFKIKNGCRYFLIKSKKVNNLSNCRRGSSIVSTKLQRVLGMVKKWPKKMRAETCTSMVKKWPPKEYLLAEVNK